MSRRERQKRRRRSRSHPVTKVLLVGAVLAVCGIALGAAAAVGWVVAVADNGPNLTELKARNPHPLTQIFAADGSSLGYVHSDTVFNPSRHRGSPSCCARPRSRSRTAASTSTARSTTRASCAPAVKDLFSGRDSLQGASTLTMQLVDNKYMPAKIAANAQPEVQDHPGQARRAAREQARQVLDPRQLPQRRPLRDGRGSDRDRRRRRGAGVLRQARVEAQPAASSR